MKQILFKFLRRINPKFKADATALYKFLQGQTDYIPTRKTPFNHSWDYWDELIKYLNDGYGLFIDEHYSKGLLLVCLNGKIRNLEIAAKCRTSLLDQLSMGADMLETDKELLKKYAATGLRKNIERAFREDREHFFSKYETWQSFNDLISRGGIA